MSPCFFSFFLSFFFFFYQLSLIRALFGGRDSNKNTLRSSLVMKLSCHWSVCLNPRAYGKNDHSEFRVPCNIQLQFNRRVSISRCSFQGWRSRSTPQAGAYVSPDFTQSMSKQKRLSPNTKHTRWIQSPHHPPLEFVCHKNTHAHTQKWKFKLTVNISNTYMSPSFCFKILK